MKFTKMHGCGNDYVYVNCFEETVDDRPALARLVSDRHFGVGGDGLICICPSDKADFAMDMYNADGSCAQMCGNGIRCVAKYVYERGMTDKTVIDVETGAGVKTLWLNVENGVVESVRVCMGQPEFKAEKIPVLTDGESFINQPMEVGGMQWNVTAVSVGNPHAVVFVDNVDWLDLPTIGPLFENCPLFPERINTEFERRLRQPSRLCRSCAQTYCCHHRQQYVLRYCRYRGRREWHQGFSPRCHGEPYASYPDYLRCREPKEERYQSLQVRDGRHEALLYGELL